VIKPPAADSVMGVSLFRDESPACFGSFSRALTSMFRLTAGETWLDDLVAFDPDDGMINLTTVLFVDSYIVIVVWILLQVSVAVLLVCAQAIARTSIKFHKNEKEVKRSINSRYCCQSEITWHSSLLFLSPKFIATKNRIVL
jgi:hypothetical protein